MAGAQKFDADVVVVGGGLVGLGLAAALGDAGIPTAVVDREDPSAALAETFDGRASALAFATWRLLRAIGVADHVTAAQPILDIRVSDGDSLLFLHYDHNEIGDEPLGFMVENRLIRRALYARLDRIDVVSLIAPAAVDRVERGRHGVELRLAGEERLRARLVVAADGARSPLRDSAGIKTIGWRYGQTGIVCTVAHERPHRGIAQERFLPAGPFAILPLTGNRASLVWTEREALAPAILAADEATFHAELAERFGDYLGALSVIGPRWSYPLALQLADRFVGRRLALVGDAAHVIHPIAGQGLNLGLRDVAALAEVLVDAARGGLDIGEADVLARYQRWRRFDTVALAVVTDSLNRLFSNDIGPVRLVRDAGLAAVNGAPPLKAFFMRHARGTVGRLPRLLQGQPLA